MRGFVVCSGQEEEGDVEEQEDHEEHKIDPGRADQVHEH